MDKKPIPIRTIILTAFISTIFTIIGSLTIVYLNKKEATLKYEILPISYFKTDSSKLSIVNIRILNDGNKECENVSFSAKFGDSIHTADYNFQQSSETITINKIYDSLSHKTFYSIPYLNPGEQVVCAFLFRSIVATKDVEVTLRSKGNIGVSSTETPEGIPLVIFWGTIGMLIIAGGLIVFIIAHQRRVIVYQEELAQKEREARGKIFDKYKINYEDELKELRSITKDNGDN